MWRERYCKQNLIIQYMVVSHYGSCLPQWLWCNIDNTKKNLNALEILDWSREGPNLFAPDRKFQDWCSVNLICYTKDVLTRCSPLGFRLFRRITNPAQSTSHTPVLSRWSCAFVWLIFMTPRGNVAMSDLVRVICNGCPTLWTAWYHWNFSKLR